MALILIFSHMGQLGTAQPTSGLDLPVPSAESVRIARSFVYN